MYEFDALMCKHNHYIKCNMNGYVYVYTCVVNMQLVLLYIVTVILVIIYMCVMCRTVVYYAQNEK